MTSFSAAGDHVDVAADHKDVGGPSGGGMTNGITKIGDGNDTPPQSPFAKVCVVLLLIISLSNLFFSSLSMMYRARSYYCEVDLMKTVSPRVELSDDSSHDS